MKNFIIIFFVVYCNLTFAQNGIVTSYYSNDVVRMELSYVNDVLEGTSYWYYHNGNLESEKTYSDGILNGWVRNFYESGLSKEEFLVKNGILDGIAKYYFGNGSLKEVRYYDKGKIIKISQFEYDNSYIPLIAEYDKGTRQKKTRKDVEVVLCDAEICPEPIGGMEAIENILIYPEEAKKYGLEGEVSVIVSVNEDGNVTNTILLKGIGLGCEEAAMDAIKKTRFLPGLNNGKIVSANVIVKVKFVLKI